MMKPAVRKLSVTIHIATSIGWFGAVAVFLALAVTGLTHPDEQRVRAAYLAMQIATRAVIVPLAFGTLATGLIVALGTRWGLLQHYWIVAKLAITIVATAVLLLHTHPVEQMAHAAAGPIPMAAEMRPLRVQLVVNAGAALLALLTAAALAVYKPRGMTAYGRQKQRRLESIGSSSTDERRGRIASTADPRSRTRRGGTPDRVSGSTGDPGTPRWVKVASWVIGVLLLLFVLLHAAGRGLGSH